jgi:hypothetical protein
MMLPNVHYTSQANIILVSHENMFFPLQRTDILLVNNIYLIITLVVILRALNCILAPGP